MRAIQEGMVKIHDFEGKALLLREKKKAGRVQWENETSQGANRRRET